MLEGSGGERSLRAVPRVAGDLQCHIRNSDLDNSRIGTTSPGWADDRDGTGSASMLPRALFLGGISLTGHHDPFVGCACSISRRISSARQTVVRSQSLIGAGYLPDLQPLNQLVRLMGMIGST